MRILIHANGCVQAVFFFHTHYVDPPEPTLFLLVNKEMNGAIFFTSKYGSTEQYANWISESTGLPMFNMKDRSADPAKFDFIILGSPIIYYKVLNQKWIEKNLSRILGKPIIFFTVSGAPAGPKLDGWIAESLPPALISQMHHIALRGRQSPAELTWYDWLMLKIGGWMNQDPQARKEELKGFDFMDHASIEPIIKRIRQIQSKRSNPQLEKI